MKWCNENASALGPLVATSLALIVYTLGMLSAGGAMTFMWMTANDSSLIEQILILTTK
jgi:hypothetical protein